MDRQEILKYFGACAQPQSNYAVEHFVDGSRLTPERRFRQAVIELDSAIEAVEEAKYHQAKLDLKIKKQKGKLFKLLMGSPERSLLSMKIDRNARRKQRSERLLEGKCKEMDKHLSMLVGLKDELGFTQHTTEEEIYDRLQKAEADYYLIKLATDTAAHIISQKGGPSVGVSLSLQQMPKEDIARFNDTLNGMLQSMSHTQYTPALHGEGDLNQIMSKGIEAATQHALQEQEER